MKLRTAAMLASALCAISGCTTVSMSSYKGGYFGNVKMDGDEIRLSAGTIRGPVYSLPYTVLIIEGGHCVSAETAKPKAEEPKKAETDKTSITITNSPTTSSTSSADFGAGDGSPARSGGAGTSDKCDATSGASPYGIRVTPLTLADPSETYQVGFDLSAFSSDTHKLKVSEGRLLTSSNSESKDESREAIVAFGKLVGTIAGGGFKPLDIDSGFPKFFETTIDPPATKPAATNPTPLQPFRRVCAIFDIPTAGTLACDTVSAGGPPQTIALASVSVKVLSGGKVTPAAARTAPGDGPLGAGKTCFSDGVCPGLLFRARSERVVSVEFKSSDTSKFADSGALFNVLMIDPDRTYSVTPIRQTFVQSKTDMTFDKGVLVGLDGVYPSSGGAILTTPIDLINAVISGAKDFLTLRVELIEKQKAYDEAVAPAEETEMPDTP